MRNLLRIRPVPLALLLIGTAATARGEGVEVDLNGSFVEAVRVGHYVVPAIELGAGESRGEVSFLDSGGFSIRAADDRDLALYFARSSTDPAWTIDVGSWRDINGGRPDFFLFEVGGNDSILVAARLRDGSWGQDASIVGWTATGYHVALGPAAGQQVFGLSFAHSDLRDASGHALNAADEIVSLRIRSSGIDGAALLFVDPSPRERQDGDASVQVVGELRAHHPMMLDYAGPWASATERSPDNPFLDHRLRVRFDGPGGEVLVVPGFFDGDGEGGDMGTSWRARFTPPVPGTWRARASFRSGPGVAVELAPDAGTSGLLDGVQTTFEVEPSSPFDPGFLAGGLLAWDGGHYRRSASGAHYVKAGCNSPENFLAYRGFDGVVDADGIGRLHSFDPHADDWRGGDPLFRSDVHDVDSRGIIGALNYLGGEGVNSQFMMLMNLGGDGCDVHPFVGPAPTHYDKTHYAVGRLAQWEAVFAHAMRMGVALHLGLGETEPANEAWLDGGALGVERKLFYREMVARFAHHPAIKWLLCEENDFPVDALREFADWIDAQDAYDHPISFHNHPNDMSDYGQVAGDARFEATSLQYDPDQIEEQVESLRALSAAAGHPWIVEADENNPWDEGLTDSNGADLRKRVLYDVLFSGAGIEWYAGWHDLPLGGDLTLEDFRTREPMWRFMRHARRFVEGLRFWEMEPADGLLTLESQAFGGGEVFALPGRTYAVYLPRATPSGILDLGGTSGEFTLRWFDPRQGEFEGIELPVLGGLPLVLGAPPADPFDDWVALVQLVEDPPPDLFADVSEISVSRGGTQKLHLVAGPSMAGRSYLVLGSLAGTLPGIDVGAVHLDLNPDRYMRQTWNHPNQGILVATAGNLDAAGEATARIVLARGDFAPLVGATMHHAYLLTDPWIDYASISVSLRLVP